MEFKENLKKYQNIINEELETYLRKENCPEKKIKQLSGIQSNGWRKKTKTNISFSNI